jgi:uncharacterized iron-regulated protein
LHQSAKTPQGVCLAGFFYSFIWLIKWFCYGLGMTYTKFLSRALFTAALSSLLLLNNSSAQELIGERESLFAMPDGSTVSVPALISVLARSDIAVLGEIHDNPRHHQLRAQLLRQLPAASKTVVAEHLNWRERFEPQAELLTGLQAAGFDSQGWGWPLHQPLFESVKAMKMPLIGGNLPGESIKEVFKTQGQSLPDPVRSLLLKAPFEPQQRQALHEEIDQGHCGAMPKTMLEGMAAVQRGRDAAMAEVALAHLPSIVVAGNGHAWKHLGVPFIVYKAAPQLRSVSVLFMEWDESRPSAEKQAFLAELTLQADYVWLTPPHERKDDCESFRQK